MHYQINVVARLDNRLDALTGEAVVPGEGGGGTGSEHRTQLFAPRGCQVSLVK